MSNQQPGWGQQPTQPGWGSQPPAPKKNTGKIIGFGCLGIIVLFVLIGIIAAIATSGDEGKKDSPPAKEPAASAPAESKKPEEPTKEEPAKKEPVTVAAKKVAFKKSVLAQNDNYTSVQVTITNNGTDEIDVNPLYVTITDTDGRKHTAELGMDEDQLDTVKLAPGENVTGTITGKGKFDAKYVTYTDGLIGDSIRGNVS